MAALYISEHVNATSQLGTLGNNVFPQPPLAEQVIAIGIAAAESNPFNARTKAILVSCDVSCSIAIGPEGETVATANNFRIPANASPIGFGVAPGYVLSVIQN